FRDGTYNMGDAIDLTWTAKDFSTSTQLVFIIQPGADAPGGPSFLSNYKIEIIDTIGGTQTVFDPTLSTIQYAYWESAAAPAGFGPSLFAISFDLTVIPAADRTQVTDLILSMPSSTYQPPFEWTIFGIFGGTATGQGALYGTSPNDPTQASYTLAYFNKGTATESPGVTVQPATGNSPSFASVGMLPNPLPNQGFGTLLPAYTHIGYEVAVPYFNPLRFQDVNAGVDTLNVYRQDFGSSDYLYAFSVTLSNWTTGLGIVGVTNATPIVVETSVANNLQTGQQVTITGNSAANGTWIITRIDSTHFSLDTSTASGAVLGGTYSAWVLVNETDAVQYVTDTVTTLELGARYAPSAYNIPIPIGYPMGYANTRLFVGGTSFYGVSEQAQPFRFNLILQTDDNGNPITRSGTQITIAGETAASFATPSAAALGSASVFMWTQKNTYAITGIDGYSLSQPSIVAGAGVYAQSATAQYKDLIFFFDDNREIRRFTYGSSGLYGYAGGNAYSLMPTITKRVVDDRTLNIPQSRLPWCSGQATFDRYYFAYTPNGQTVNNRILVYDETLGFWVEDTLSFGAESMAYATFSGGKVLLLQGSDGNLYTHENTASSTPLSCRITSGLLNRRLWDNLFFGRIGIVCDIQTGQTASISRILYPSGTDSSTMDLSTDAVGKVWRFDTRDAGTPYADGGDTMPGASGLGCQIDIQLTMVPGTRLYSIVMETEPRRDGADQL
ncbi:MAG TPA: hypothetical protein VG944_08665, partial [Fimbriimonas sp.]|nr:hypothetical protein [Fimbriimonas sp.]